MRLATLPAAAALAAAVLVAGCAGTGAHQAGGASPTTSAPAGAGVAQGATTSAPPATAPAPTTAAPTTTTTTTAAPTTTGPASASPASASPAAASQAQAAPLPTLPAGAEALPPTGSGPLGGKVIALDPGHNGDNYLSPSVINAPIFNGRASEACDTTGTETDSGYTEALFNWEVAQYAAAALRNLGATVVLTRSSNSGVGPCVTERAAIGNAVRADAAVSIHADGGPPGGRGFAVLLPVADGPNDGVIAASTALGSALRSAFSAGTGEPYSTYDGVNGLQSRDDLAGTNLTTVPKVFIECANMRNVTDAALVTSASWQQQAGAAVAAGIEAFVAGG